MVEKPEIPKKQIAAFKCNCRPDLRIPPLWSSNHTCFSDYLKRSQADRFLEDAIVNNIGIRLENIRTSATEIKEALLDLGETEQPRLTRREVQILKLILAGKTNKQIARALSRSAELSNTIATDLCTSSMRTMQSSWSSRPLRWELPELDWCE